jgi:hypothetical protein
MLLAGLGLAGRKVERGAEVAADRRLVAERTLERRSRRRRKKRGRRKNRQENRPSHALSPRLLRPFLRPFPAEATQFPAASFLSG